MYRIVTFICLLVSSSLFTQNKNDSLLKIAENDILSSPDSAIEILDSILKSEQPDSIFTARIYHALGRAYDSKSDHVKSFDYSYSALQFLHNDPNSVLYGAINNNLGKLYGNFDLDVEALEYFQKAADYYKNHSEQDIYHSYSFVLLNIAGAKSYQKNYEEALEFIIEAEKSLEKTDKLTLEEKSIRLAIVGIEKANTLFMLHKVDSAKVLALNSHAVLENSQLLYPLSLSHYYLGKIFSRQDNLEKAFFHTTKADSLENVFGDLQSKRDINFLFSEIYEKQNKPSIALDYLKEGKEIDEALFSAKEASAFYRLRRDAEIKEEKQRLAIVEKDKKLSDTLSLLYSISSLALLIIGTLFIINLRTKYKKEKKLIVQQQSITRLELTNTKDILKIKEKELTTAALQIIENGETVKKLKKDVNALKPFIATEHHDKIESLTSSISNNSYHNWGEFKKRFEQVNSSFFTNLKQTHAGLTANELKLSAFLKLNFNSKDIANLMGISHESVRVSRYRLRKKLNLQRNENLVGYISRF